MHRAMPIACALAAIFAFATAGARARHDETASTASALNAQRVDDAPEKSIGQGSRGASVLRAQILLDRARFSPGEIDASYGSNLRHAIAGYQAAHGLDATGTIDAATWNALDADTAPALTQYMLTDVDLAGPFAPVPEDMMEKAKLPALGYESVIEAIGERFHASPTLLHRLNPQADLAQAGETLVVPAIIAPEPVAGAARVVVAKNDSTVSILDAEGRTLAQFPASTGSDHDPLPIGEWKIRSVTRDPVFHYDPALFWDADTSQAKATIAAGPNNPVGVVWIDLSIPHYGIHGTPEPSKIGKTQSHGCIRLTNWDALTLAQSVKAGMPAELKE
jgi:lipoprotein-anchoring transpeptidase ErfK/SrfK